MMQTIQSASISNPIRLGILGCGAITAGNHLPSAVAHPYVRITALVDCDLGRARLLRRHFHLECEIAADYETVLGRLDAVIIALPNYLHAPAILAAVKAGVHVLCEKPLALTVAEARVCSEAAQRQNVLLAVGMQWRFRDSSVLLPLVLDEGLLGSLLDYDWEHGHQWDWAATSGFYFSRVQAGGGVLIDIGVHALDSLIQWFGPVAHCEYRDDNWGGNIEANSILTLHHIGHQGEVTGRVRLSRTFTLKNRLLVRGKQSQAEIHAADPNTIVLHRVLGGQNVSEILRTNGTTSAAPVNPFYRQLDNFVKSIGGTQELVSDGWQAVEVMELVERCYGQAGRIPEPWSEI
jgi:predicted dehydrogenase